MSQELAWWQPGGRGTLLSGRWAQAFVFSLPASVPPSELETSLRYRVKALLPTSDLPLLTRIVRFQGRRWGLVVANRLPESAPPIEGLTLGMPLHLPKPWPSACLLAVAVPEGWELHLYEERVLSKSFPPVEGPGPALNQILEQRPMAPVLWTAPDPRLVATPPPWAQHAPPWPRSLPWGVSLQRSKEVRWPWLVGTLLVLAGVVSLALGAMDVLRAKETRNHRWDTWVKTARTLLGDPAVSRQKELAALKRGEPVEDVLLALSVWSSDVAIQRLDLRNGKLTVTARAQSALSAAARLGQDNARSGQWRIVQIRQVAGGEEFDLEGSVAP